MKLVGLCFGLLFSAAALASPDLVKVKGYDLEYEIAGEGSEVILLEAGGSAGMSDWDPVFKQMSEHAKVIRYSRVGNGQSTAIKQHFTSRDYAEHASILLTELDVKQPVIFIAHSYGGSVARDFAAAYPEQIKALMMLDPSSEHDVDILRAIDLEKGNQEIAEIKLADMKGGMSNQYLDFWSKRPLPDYPEIKDMPVTVIASVRTMENPPNLFFTEQGRKMWGELWQAWANAFPQGKSVLTEKSGHFVQFDEPDLVLSELLALMQRL
ncbi:alpha/beta fold hydrolase [Idiomarina sp. UBA3162]|uniref:alpha/beta fold hydrolase n=1 Tax=Idiomarina sp. UBA3162 TaxID=1946641 RepID=UPI0025B9BCC7|nr:alpha/beta hydrolase [Idiomarina sp. UBA3162]